MSYHLTPCPKCRTDVLVRYEHVITGTQVSRNYYCGACDHTWMIHEISTGELKPPTRSGRNSPGSSEQESV
jgi:hypothetical protein